METKYPDFLRRPVALFVDVLIIGVCTWLVSLLPLGLVERLGPLGPFFGTVVVLVYFGLGNSRVWGGQTLGKRFVRIRVVGADGEPISVARSVARAAIFWVPFQFDDFMLPGVPEAMTTVWGGLFAVSATATVIFYIFNKPSRRCPHDYLTESGTVEQLIGVPVFAPQIPKKLLWVTGGLAVLLFGSTAWTLVAPPEVQADLGPLLQGYEAGQQVEGIWGLGVHLNTSTRTVDGQERTTKVLRINARVNRPKKEHDRLAVDLAQTVLRAMPDFPGQIAVQVNLQTGIHFGYFNTTKSDARTHSAAQWRRIDPERPTVVPSDAASSTLEKNAVARTHLGTIVKAVLDYYENSVDMEAAHRSGKSGEAKRSLPPSGAAIPGKVPGAQAITVPTSAWSQPGWSDIGVKFQNDLSFSYELEVAADRQSFVASARGDFDEDGVESLLTLGGQLQTRDGDEYLILDTQVAEVNLGE